MKNCMYTLLTRPGKVPIVYLYDGRGRAVRYLMMDDFRWQNQRQRLWPNALYTGAFEVSANEHTKLSGYTDRLMPEVINDVSKLLLGESPLHAVIV